MDTKHPDPIRAEILRGFQGKMEPGKPTAVYLLGLVLVAAVMVLLPVLYLAFVGLIGYAVYYHAVHHIGMIDPGRHNRDGVGTAALFGYVAPLIIGGVVILFLLRPLSSRRFRRGKPVSLGRKAEPLLFAFVDRVSAAVGAAPPRRIDVDCNVNASAGFAHGIWSMLTRDLVLTVGAPLVGGLTLHQFAGVVAHELGHFSQAAGMRLTYLIRSISAWFTRVVYERDHWDERLRRQAFSISAASAWLLYVPLLFIWLTRMVLWLFMMVGHLVSGFMLRQMECDADRKSIRLAGSKAFTTASRQTTILNIAAQAAQDNLNQFYREGRLPDDLPRLIIANAQQLPPSVEAAMTQLVKKGSTGWLDTHPCDRERLAHAERENAPGIFHSEQLASVLFRDLAKISKKSTTNLYRAIFGAGIKRQTIQPIEELLTGHGEEMESYKALKRYFQAAFQPARALPLPRWGFSKRREPKQATLVLRRHRQAVEELQPDYIAACKSYFVASKQKQANLEARMGPFETSAAERLFAALELLHAPGMEKRLLQAEAWRRETATLLAALKTLNDNLEPLAKAARLHRKLEKLLTELATDQKNEDLYRRLCKKAGEALQLIVNLRQDLSVVDYPFEHSKCRLSIASYALPDVVLPNNAVAIYYALGNFVHCVYRLRARVVGRLCVFAEQAELAVGLTASSTA
jgi:Zn-dependent protease with chaperone function